MQARPSTPTLDFRASTLRAPRGDLWGLAWIPNGWLFSNYLSDPSDSTHEASLWRYRADGTDFAKTDLPADPSCRLLAYLRPTALADGHLASIRECSRLSNDGVITVDASLIALDVGTGEVSTLASVDQTTGVTGVSSFAWDTRHRQGVISIGSGICQGIQRISAAGLEPVNLELSEGGHRFNLADQFQSDGIDCTNTGMASLPTISSDGARIAFVASPASMGLEGQTRLDAPSNIYIADSAFSGATIALAGLTEFGALQWSPDGRTLAVSGRIAKSGKGLWLVDAASGSATIVSNLDLADLAWSPDGKQIAALDGPAASTNDVRVHLFAAVGTESSSTRLGHPAPGTCFRTNCAS